MKNNTLEIQGNRARFKKSLSEIWQTEQPTLIQRSIHRQKLKIFKKSIISSKNINMINKDY